MTRSETMLWRRLDATGHDACRLDVDATSRHLRGTAVFLHEAAPAQLRYEVQCDAAWRLELARVTGWVGARNVAIRVERHPTGRWSRNGSLVDGLASCVDLDFGFTPATNVTQIRRIQLAVGQAMAVPVAWMDVDSASLTVLQQRYERRTEREYWYESSTAGYSALLEVSPNGFVVHYPGLWASLPMP